MRRRGGEVGTGDQERRQPLVGPATELVGEGAGRGGGHPVEFYGAARRGRRARARWQDRRHGGGRRRSWSSCSRAPAARSSTTRRPRRGGGRARARAAGGACASSTRWRCGCASRWSGSAAARPSCPALYETARDLTAIRDLDAILAAIVRRARQLLGADMTYLSLNDEADGASYMKVTDGALTPEFRTLRLPLGTGLLGLVAQSGAPYFTEDYQADERFVHRDYIDTAVDGEQIRAILGVPLDGRGHGDRCAARGAPHGAAVPAPGRWRC